MDHRQRETLSLFDTPDWLRVVGVFDLETTGVDVVTDRIVTAHVGVLDAAGSVMSARDWLAANWDKQGEPPALPDEIVEQTADRYRELIGRLRG